MAFPTIPTTGAGQLIAARQADTSATRTFPDLSGLTKASGDLLIAIVCGWQSSATANAVWSSWGGSFTEFGDFSTTTTTAIGCAYKWSTGSETGTFTVTEAATISGHATMIVMAIPGAHASTPPEAGSYATGTGAAADPASFNPTGWDVEDTLWISVCGSGMVATTGTYTGVGATFNTTPWAPTGPTNFTNGYGSGCTGDANASANCEVGVAFRQQAAASQDVGTWGCDTTNARNAAIVIAVRPAPPPPAVPPIVAVMAPMVPSP